MDPSNKVKVRGANPIFVFFRCVQRVSIAGRDSALTLTNARC